MTVYLITNQYLIDVRSVPVVYSQSRLSLPKSDLGDPVVVRTKYSVLMSSSSIRNSSSLRISSSGDNTLHNLNPNENSRQETPNAHPDQIQIQGENNNAHQHQTQDWFQALKVSRTGKNIITCQYM